MKDLFNGALARLLVMEPHEAVLGVQLLDRHVDREVTVLGIAVDISKIADRRAVVFAHGRSADTAARAGRHLDKAVFQIPADNVLQRGDAVLLPVNDKICIVRRLFVHGAQNAP